MKPHVGVIGVSKGGDLALSMATFIPEVSLAVSINGSCYNLNWPLRINDHKVLPPLYLDFSQSDVSSVYVGKNFTIKLFFSIVKFYLY